MAEVKWIKITTDMFDNRKIKHLRKMPDGNNLVLIWIMLLTMAGRCNANGMIFLTETFPYSTKMLADELDFEENTVKLALNVFELLGMVKFDGEFMSITGWDEYQNIDGMEKIRLQNRARKQKQREKERLLLEGDHDMSRDSHVTVTRCHATDIDIDKDIDKDINNNIRSNFEQEFDQLWDIYPRKQGKKRAFEAYKRARKKGATFELVRDGIARYARYIVSEKLDMQFVKQGSTFFSQEAWMDEWHPSKGSNGVRLSNEEDDTLDGIL